MSNIGVLIEIGDDGVKEANFGVITAVASISGSASCTSGPTAETTAGSAWPRSLSEMRSATFCRTML